MVATETKGRIKMRSKHDMRYVYTHIPKTGDDKWWGARGEERRDNKREQGSYLRALNESQSIGNQVRELTIGRGRTE